MSGPVLRDEMSGTGHRLGDRIGLSRGTKKGRHNVGPSVPIALETGLE